MSHRTVLSFWAEMKKKNIVLFTWGQKTISRKQNIINIITFDVFKFTKLMHTVFIL